MSKMSELGNLWIGDDVCFFIGEEESMLGVVVEVKDFLFDMELEGLYNIYNVQYVDNCGDSHIVSISSHDIDAVKQHELIRR
jgi:hypothetical protein